jgi:hypothetical protein
MAGALSPTADAPGRYSIGRYRDVELEVAVWDAVGAAVDLSCAGMFTHEVDAAPLLGGLLDLDAALDGALLRLRGEGVFQGEELETVLIATPPSPIRGQTLMLIGLGEPSNWTPAVMTRAARVAVREGVRLGARSVSFAPGMLDSGLTPTGASQAMLGGVTSALDAEHRLVALGLTQGPSLQTWTFAAGAAHAQMAAEQFRAELLRIQTTNV